MAERHPWHSPPCTCYDTTREGHCVVGGLALALALHRGIASFIDFNASPVLVSRPGADWIDRGRCGVRLSGAGWGFLGLGLSLLYLGASLAPPVFLTTAHWYGPVALVLVRYGTFSDGGKATKEQRWVIRSR